MNRSSNHSEVLQDILKAVAAANHIGPVFHGTTHDFEVFSLEHASDTSWYGKAFFFTNYYDDAQGYSSPDNDDLADRIGKRRDEILREAHGNEWDSEVEEHGERWATEEMNKAWQGAKGEIAGPSRTIKRVHLRLNNPVQVSRGVNDFLKKGVFTALEFEAAVRNLGLYNFIIAKPGQFVADTYRALGFDGVIMTPSSVFKGRGLKFPAGVKHYVVWDVSQIENEEK